MGNFQLVFSELSHYIYSMNIVKIAPDSLTLSSGLSQDSFAKTNTASLLSERCSLIHFDGGRFFSEPYVFDSTAAENDKTVFFKGKAVKGTLLSEILLKKNEDFSESDIFALISFCKAVDFACEQQDFSGAVGAGGIIINANPQAKSADILFISKTLFEECARHHKEQYAAVQGKFLYKGLEFPYSLIFLRAVVAYKALTNHFPFEDDDTTKRQEDIFDENFIPLRLWSSKIDENLAESIESALRLKPNQEITAGKRIISDSKTAQNRQKTLKKAKLFDSERLKKNLEQRCAPELALEKKRSAFVARKARILSVKRFLRRNKNRILASLAAIFVISWFVSGIVRENAKLVTTKGLDSTQTTAVLYTMIHRADVPNLQEIAKGKETKDLIVKMSGLYVSAKQRLEVNPDNGTVPPAHWFFYKKESKNWMFGITHLSIDGKDFKAENDYSVKKDKPIPIREENGTILQKGDEITHTAEYYFVRQQETRFIIEKMTDTVTLRWNGRQWQVIKVEGSAKPQSVKSKDFIEEYYALLEKEKSVAENGSKESPVRSALETLRATHGWIPAEEDLRAAAQFLYETYGSTEAEQFLR